MLYTLGHTTSYERYLSSDPAAAKGIGGSVWRTPEEAARHAPAGYSVYGVDAQWDVDTRLDPAGHGWHELTREAPLCRVPQPPSPAMKDEPSTPTVPPTAEALLEAQRELERQIAEDAFNVAESDFAYFQRRLAYHQARQN